MTPEPENSPERWQEWFLVSGRVRDVEACPGWERKPGFRGPSWYRGHWAESYGIRSAGRWPDQMLTASTGGVELVAVLLTQMLPGSLVLQELWADGTPYAPGVRYLNGLPGTSRSSCRTRRAWPPVRWRPTWWSRTAASRTSPSTLPWPIPAPPTTSW